MWEKKLCSLRGSSLIMVLIVLTVLLISSLAFFRSSNVANLIAGNMVSKKAALAAADLGIAQAETDLLNLTNMETNTPGLYYALQQPVDTNGLPKNVDWTQIPIVNVQNYQVQRVIERLCNGSLPIQNFNASCLVQKITSPASKKFGSQVYSVGTALFYRVTTRVSGPHNTLVFVQAMITR